MKVLVTGSSGLIGSEAVAFFDKAGFPTVGVDNNMRAQFFGPEGDTTPNLNRLRSTCKNFAAVNIDIRNREALEAVFARHEFSLVVHAAAQPSHELAASRPFEDFDVNAVGTLNVLELCRRHCPKAVLVYLSTSKVYGDRPNRIPLKELDTRWEFDDPRYEHGIDETFPIDACLHSLYGTSKLSADLLVQEYGRYYGMRTGVFRGGCLTGRQHAGVESHGFLSYLVHASLSKKPYTIFGYQGKQVRDQIHSRDVIEAIWQFAQNPRPGEVYNLGGGKENSASLLECMNAIEQLTGNRAQTSYSETPRLGDQICYYSDTRKFRSHYPAWKPTFTLEKILQDLIAGVALSSRAP